MAALLVIVSWFSGKWKKRGYDIVEKRKETGHGKETEKLQWRGEDRILKEHLVNGVAVSELCDKYKIHPTLFYRWQQQLFENGAKVFESGNNQEKTQMKQQIAKLEEKVAKRNEVCIFR